MEFILSATKLNKVFEMSKGNHHQVLKDVDAAIRKGEFLSVMGPSGSGKSTLLYSMSGMDQITSGEVSFLGTQLDTMPEDKLAALRLKRMGFIFQQSNLLKNLDIIDNVLFPGYMARQESRQSIKARGRRLMERTGILGIQHHDITQASGGQLQRAAICRALINKPEILFGDEPTGALNSKAAGEVMDIMGAIHEQGTTIMLVTHDARVAARTERVLFMTDGSITGELKLGSLRSDQQLKERERRLADWLSGMGF